MRRLVCTAGGSRKFWEGRVEGTRFVVRFGRLGTEGQVKEKDLGSPAAAERELAKVAAEKLRGGYVEEAPAAGARPAAGAAPAATPASASAAAAGSAAASAAAAATTGAGDEFPYLFYGASPADWYEGANDGHVFELCFRSAPDEATARRLAARFEADVARGPVQGAAEAWLWSGRFATLALGERFRVNGPALFRRFDEIIGALHRVHPLEQVTFYGARERAPRGSDPWSEWSERTRPTPLPGPSSPHDAALYPRATDPALAVYAPWPAFEAGRRAQEDQAARAKIAKIAAEAAGPLRLAAVDVELPPWEAAPPALRGLCKNPDDRVVPGPQGRAAIWRLPDHGSQSLLLADAKGKVRRTDVDHADTKPVWHPSGEALFVGVRGCEVARVAWGTGAAETVFAEPKQEAIYSLEMTRGGLVVGTKRELLLLDADAPERGAVTSHRAGGYTAGTVLQGRVLWACGLGRDATAIVAAAPGTLKRIATIPADGCLIEHEGKVYFSAYGGVLEVRGLEEAAGAVAGSTARAAAKAAGGGVKAAAPAIEPIAAAQVVRPPEVPRELREKFKRNAEWVLVTSTGRAVGANTPENLYPKQIAWLDDAGSLREYRMEETRFSGVDSHADGTIVRGGTFALYVHHANSDGPARKLELTGTGNRILDVAFVGDHYAVLAEKGLSIHDRKGALLAEGKFAKGQALLVLGGGRFAVCLGEAKDRIVVFEVLPGPKLKAILRSSLQWTRAHAAGGRCFVCDAAGHWFELRGLS